MCSFLSDTFFKSFSNKYFYVEAATNDGILLPIVSFRSFLFSPVYTVYNVHSHTHMCVKLLWMNGYSCTDCTLWRGPNTHPLHLFQYSIFKYCIILLHCQFIKNISDNSFLTRPGSVVTHFEWYRGNSKKIAKFLMRTFACRSTFLYGEGPPS